MIKLQLIYSRVKQFLDFQKLHNDPVVYGMLNFCYSLVYKEQFSLYVVLWVMFYRRLLTRTLTAVL